jgi:hypothetical protein
VGATSDRALALALEEAERNVREHLNELGTRNLRRTLRRVTQQLWPKGEPVPSDDPIRTKNLEKSAGFLHAIRERLLDGTRTGPQSTCCLLGLLAPIHKLPRLSASNAWELADSLELELIRSADRDYIRARLEEEVKSAADARHSVLPLLYLEGLKEAYTKEVATAALAHRETAPLHEPKAPLDARYQEAKYALMRIHQARIDEYRRDRAKVKLRGKYLRRMASILGLLLLSLCFLYVSASRSGLRLTASRIADKRADSLAAKQRADSAATRLQGASADLSTIPDTAATSQTPAEPVRMGADTVTSGADLRAAGTIPKVDTQAQKGKGDSLTENTGAGGVGTTDGLVVALLSRLVVLVLCAGAVGSVLRQAVKLSKQPLHEDPERKASEPPLGIRALMSGWEMVWAQPVIGASFAVILFLVFQAGLIPLDGLGKWGPAEYGVMGFLAGFSEPFVLRTLERVSGAGGALG